MSTTASTSDNKEFSTNAYSGLTKPNSTTFNDWKLQLTTVLGAQRLSKCILRDITPPTDEKALDDHETFSIKTLTAIHATINAEISEVICLTSCPRLAFKMLRKHHNDTYGLSTAKLFSELVTMRLSSDGSFKNHSHRFRKLHNYLISNIASSPKLSISEPFVAIILIDSLPSNFTRLVQSLLTLTRLYSLPQMEATHTSTNSSGDTVLSSVKNKSKGKQKELTAPSNGLVCSLGYPGHTDENWRVQRWKAFKEFEKQEKSKRHPDTPKVAEPAQITSASVDVSSSDDAHVWYWESAFCTTLSSDSSPQTIILGETGAS